MQKGAATIENGMRFLKILKMELLCDPAILFLGVYTEELKSDLKLILSVLRSLQHYAQ